MRTTRYLHRARNSVACPGPPPKSSSSRPSKTRRQERLRSFLHIWASDPPLRHGLSEPQLYPLSPATSSAGQECPCLRLPHPRNDRPAGGDSYFRQPSVNPIIPARDQSEVSRTLNRAVMRSH